MAKLLKSDGTILDVTPEKGRLSLDEMQKFVGGYIEHVDLDKGRHLIVNEEGKVNGLPGNRLATDEWCKMYGPTDFICGDALILEPNEFS